MLLDTRATCYLLQFAPLFDSRIRLGPWLAVDSQPRAPEAREFAGRKIRPAPRAGKVLSRFHVDQHAKGKKEARGREIIRLLTTFCSPPTETRCKLRGNTQAGMLIASR